MLLKSGSVLAVLFFTSVIFSAEVEPNYDEHIVPILRQHCLKCHGEDKQKADLNMQSYADTMKGGSGGEIVVAGRSSQSSLFQAITDPDDDARMPPNKPSIPKEQISMIQAWIDSGLRQSSKSTSMVAKRDTTFTPHENAGTKPESPAMPENLPTIDIPKTVCPLPVLAMSASPWAPLLAVSGQEHVRLINTETEQEIGRLPFPEGIPHVLRFSRDGSVLMVAGGKPVQSGKVVLFDVKTGRRLAEIGDEIDSVLAADLSPDQQLVALGGSGKIVKVYSTSDGALRYKIEKHTDWVTSLTFSPDGTKLASADRAGGLHLWDAATGGIVLSLSEHKAAIRDLDWRSDSRILASVGEDGRIIWWDVTDGWPSINRENAHPPRRPEGFYGKIPNGVLAARFAMNGKLASAGRDHLVQLWDEKGISQKRFQTGEEMPISTAITYDGSKVISGDTRGNVRFWQ